MTRKSKTENIVARSMSEQSWDPERYSRHARFVSELGEPLIRLLAPQSHERILDLGCGDGALSAVLAEQVEELICIDRSPEQVAAARRRGLAAFVMDAHDLKFESEFDAVFSNAVLHWMRDSRAVISGVWRSLKPGGRFVAEMGGAGNVESIKAELVAALDRRGVNGDAKVPWYFPMPQEYGQMLEHQGFSIRRIELLPRPTPLPGDIEGWFETFAEPFLNALDINDRAGYIAEVRDRLRPALCDDSGTWVADYVRLRFDAVRTV